MIWSVRAHSFMIQPYKITSKSGLFYKKQISILLNKVDHINISQGALNKLFKNGNVIINTTGSSQAEIEVKNLRDYQDFYTVLKDYY